MAFVNIPPNFQDMFYALSDRIAKLETGPNQAMYVAESAQGSSAQASEEAAQALLEASEANAEAAAASAQAVQAATAAGIAQAQATTALQQANAAFISANNSLKPSADTIVNSQNQMTAISTNGITVFSGASATTGARVVMNSAGLAGFNSSGAATFSILASTGAATFSGNVTGSTITGGTLNIAGNAIINSSGLLTATGATITGTINAQAGYFGTPTNGWSISSNGLVGVGTGTIVGGTISGTTFTNGSTFSVSSGGFLTASSGSIGGWLIGTSTLSATSGTKTLTLNSSTAILDISDSSTGILSGGGINMSAGGNTGSYGANGFSYNGLVSVRLSGSNLLLQGGATSAITLQPGAGLGSTTFWVQVEGHLNSASYTLSSGTWSDSSTSQTPGSYMSASGAIIARRANQIPFFAHRYSTSGTSEMIRLVYNGSDAGGITTTAAGSPAFRTASDYRLKDNITDFTSATDIVKALRLRSFTYNIQPDKPTVGFIAHELQEVLPDLVLGEKDAVDEDGNPIYQAITATNLIPYLTGALKDVIVRLEALEA